MPSTKIHAYESDVSTIAVEAEPMSNHQNFNSTGVVAGDTAPTDYQSPNNNSNYDYSNNDYPTKPSSPHSSYNTNNTPRVVVTRPAVPAVAHVEYPYPPYVHIDSRNPVTLSYCPNCAKEHVSTHTRTRANGVTMICVVIGVVVFWPLFWVPLVVKPMKQTNHYCKNCGVKVGRVKPFQ
jgi:predicted RNA-binding Zn-ribbon protein involved in translation (DUF1610 family)